MVELSIDGQRDNSGSYGEGVHHGARFGMTSGDAASLSDQSWLAALKRKHDGAYENPDLVEPESKVLTLRNGDRYRVSEKEVSSKMSDKESKYRITDRNDTTAEHTFPVDSEVYKEVDEIWQARRR